MSKQPGKCRTCNSRPDEIGNYCAECTLKYIVGKWGWLDHWWFTTTITGGTRGGRPEKRLDKQAALRQAMRVYAISYGTEQARKAFSDAVRSILLKWPCYRSLGTNGDDNHKDTGYINPRVKNLNYFVRLFVTQVERRIRRNHGKQRELAQDDFGNDFDK